MICNKKKRHTPLFFYFLIFSFSHFLIFSFSPFLKVHTHVQEEAAVADGLEIVFADVGQTEVEARLGIDHLGLSATGAAQTTIAGGDKNEGS